jgi:ferritin-like metal-binding protein YciE
MRSKRNESHNQNDNSNNNGSSTSSEAFGRNITAIYGLNLALSYENAAIDRLQRRLSQCYVPEVKRALERHLRQTKEQQHRLRKRIEVLAGAIASGKPIMSSDTSVAGLHTDAMKATNEKGRLPIPEPPASLKGIMESVGTDREREVIESVNDLIIEKAEAVMYKAGLEALKLLQADKKTMDVLKKNLKEEERFGKWLEKNNPRVAKKLMEEQMRKRKKEKQQLKQEKQDTKEEEQEAAAMSQ